MAIETRNRKGRYYYRKVRYGSRVRSIYLGSGPLADLYAAVYAQDREEARAAREARETVVQGSESALLTAQVEEYCRRVTLTMRETLTTAGYHRHKRGEWRRKRGG